MRFIADLHIHSRYSRATSKEMSPESLWRWAQLKGITVLGTGDFTHPGWLKELKQKLELYDNNLLKIKSIKSDDNIPFLCRSEIYFLLSAEISCIYSKNGKTRKIHCLIFVPDFSTADSINAVLTKIGNLKSDGRPILGLDAKKLFSIVLNISPEAMFIPAHAWTPHFSVFGAESGFDSLDECFEELSPQIFAIETGLSSDPSMNWRLSSLDNITLVSNSDAHSPSKLGREANIFDTDLSYQGISDAIKTRKGFSGTIEFFPEEGKYHYDGHRACKINLSPEETKKYNYLCPVCGKRLTVGVMHRIEKLADRQEGLRPKDAPSFHSVIPLPEILSETLKVGANSKTVHQEYIRLLNKLGSEFSILLDKPLDDIEASGSSLLREAIRRMRSGNINIVPGFDGEYGKIKIFEDVQRQEIRGQQPLF